MIKPSNRQVQWYTGAVYEWSLPTFQVQRPDESCPDVATSLCLFPWHQAFGHARDRHLQNLVVDGGFILSPASSPHTSSHSIVYPIVLHRHHSLLVSPASRSKGQVPSIYTRLAASILPQPRKLFSAPRTLWRLKHLQPDIKSPPLAGAPAAAHPLGCCWTLPASLAPQAPAQAALPGA